METARSFRSFMGKKGVPGVEAMGLAGFVRDTPFIRGREGRAGLWEYYKEYHVLRDCSAVLILVYEDVVNDMPTAVRMLRDFMGIPDDEHDDGDGLVDRVVRMGSREVMTQFNDKFDEPYDRAKRLGRVGDLTQLSPAAKVSNRQRQSLSENDKTVDDEAALEFIHDEWRRVMSPLGYDDYKSFVHMIRQKNASRFLDVSSSQS